MTKEFLLAAELSPRDCEVLAAEFHGALREGADHFRFTLDSGFLPTIGWLERLRPVLATLVEQKVPVEMAGEPAQTESLRRAGFHLISDLAASRNRPLPPDADAGPSARPLAPA